MGKIFLILKNWEIYKDWRRIRKGEKVINMRKGAGYYITVGLLGANPIGIKEEWKMKSGKVALVELIEYDTFRDPSDMIKESRWHQSGYKGEKPFKEMKFEEYLELFS